MGHPFVDYFNNQLPLNYPSVTEWMRTKSKVESLPDITDLDLALYEYQPFPSNSICLLKVLREENGLLQHNENQGTC